MTRNLKVMGLTMAAVFMLGAVYASAAAAQQGELTSDGPVTLTGTEIPKAAGGENRLNAFGASVECPESTYTGHKWQSTPHGFLNATGETTATLTPEYKETTAGGAANCKVAVVGWTATIDMNGCDYVAHIGETVDDEDNTYDVTVDVDCPTGKEITVTFWTSGVSHLLERNCIMHVPDQPGLTGAHATDTTDGHILLEGKITGITVTRTGTKHGGVLCPKDSVTQTHTATFDIDATVSGHDEDLEPTDIGLSHS